MNRTTTYTKKCPTPCRKVPSMCCSALSANTPLHILSSLVLEFDERGRMNGHYFIRYVSSSVAIPVLAKQIVHQNPVSFHNTLASLFQFSSSLLLSMLYEASRRVVPRSDAENGVHTTGWSNRILLRENELF